MDRPAQSLRQPAVAALVPPPEPGVVRNLNGQKLGRKGRDTRQRILDAAAALIAEGGEEPVSLSAIARRCSLGMTSLYLYFSDLSELLLAVLEPVMAGAEEAYIRLLRDRWPDDALGQHCREFVAAYHVFWKQHSRILHLRNSLADQRDVRMMQHRIDSALPVMQLLLRQMDCDPQTLDRPATGMASMLMTGIERAVTVWTDMDYPRMIDGASPADIDRFLQPAARLLELGIRDERAQAGA